MEYRPEEYFDSAYLSIMQDKLDALKKKIAVDVEMDPNELDPIIEKVIGPDPQQFEPILEQYAAVGVIFGAEAQWGDNLEATYADAPKHTISSWVESASGKVSNWQGKGPASYEKHFLKYYKYEGFAIRQQRMTVNALQVVTQAHQAIYVKSRRDVVNLLDKGSELLEAKCEEEIKITILLVAAISTFAAGPSGWSLLAASGSFAASVVGASEPGKGEAVLAGCCEMHLLYSLEDELDLLLGHVTLSEARIVASILELNSSLNDKSVRGEIVGPALPDLDGILNDDGEVGLDYKKQYLPS